MAETLKAGLPDISKLLRADDEIISKPVGIYLTSGVKTPFYAARKRTLVETTPERSRAFQILVDFLGGLQWINVEERDVTFNEGQK